MANDLTCVIFVDTDLPHFQVVEKLSLLLSGRVDAKTMVAASWGDIYVEENDDYDREKCALKDNGFVFFPFRLEIDPTDGTTEKLYISGIRELILALQAAEWRPVAACDFEGKL